MTSMLCPGASWPVHSKSVCARAGAVAQSNAQPIRASGFRNLRIARLLGPLDGKACERVACRVEAVAGTDGRAFGDGADDIGLGYGGDLTARDLLRDADPDTYNTHNESGPFPHTPPVGRKTRRLTTPLGPRQDQGDESTVFGDERMTAVRIGPWRYTRPIIRSRDGGTRSGIWRSSRPASSSP